MQLILKSLMFAALFAGVAMGLTQAEEEVKPIKVAKASVAVVQDYKAIELPEDGMKYFTTLFMPANYKEDAKCRNIVAWFETDPRLRGLKETTHFAIYTDDSVMWRERYAGSVGYTPAVCVNDAKGKSLFFSHEFPQNGQGLADQISQATLDSDSEIMANGWRRDRRRQGAWCPDNRNGCPFPAPPKPPVAPPVAVPAPRPPTIVETPKKKGFSVLWVTLAAAVGAVGAVVTEYKNESKRKHAES